MSIIHIQIHNPFSVFWGYSIFSVPLNIGTTCSVRMQNFPKTNISNLLISTRSCADLEVKNISFLENFVYRMIPYSGHHYRPIRSIIAFYPAVSLYTDVHRGAKYTSKLKIHFYLAKLEMIMKKTNKLGVFL